MHASSTTPPALPPTTRASCSRSSCSATAATNTCVCPVGQRLYSNDAHCQGQGREHHKFTGAKASCVPCGLRKRCLRTPERTAVRQVAMLVKRAPAHQSAIEVMKAAIDSTRGRRLYSQRIATVEPVFANLRHNKRLNRFTLRGRAKVGTRRRHAFAVVLPGAQLREDRAFWAVTEGQGEKHRVHLWDANLTTRA